MEGHGNVARAGMRLEMGPGVGLGIKFGYGARHGAKSETRRGDGFEDSARDTAGDGNIGGMCFFSIQVFVYMFYDYNFTSTRTLKTPTLTSTLTSTFPWLQTFTQILTYL